MNEVTVTDKSSKNINIACWTIWIITGLVVAVPYIPTFWLWIPLWIAGLICTIIAFVKARYVTGIVGLMWSLIGIWVWWFISGLITVAIFGATGAANLEAPTAEEIETRIEAEAQAEAKEQAKTKVQNISWDEIDAIYNIKSKKTDLQKDHLWKNYENKYVRWQGTVSDIGEGLLGGLRLSMKMNSNTFTFDLSIELKDSEKNKALQLSKGDVITFKGRLKSWGSLLPITIDKGEIQ